MYALFLDIDNTIYENDVSEGVVNALSRAKDAGHKVFISTARAYIGMPKEIYDLPVDGFINSFGLEICLGGKFIHRAFIPREKLLEIASFAYDNKVNMYFEGEIRVDINHDDPGERYPKSMEQFKEMLGDKKICKFIFYESPTDEQTKRFINEFDLVGKEGIFKGYSKSFGINLVERYCGLPHDKTVAIGDSDPDIDMISYAGIGIAMGNATTALMQCARYVTKSIQEDGVAYAIDCLLNDNLEPLIKR